MLKLIVVWIYLFTLLSSTAYCGLIEINRMNIDYSGVACPSETLSILTTSDSDNLGIIIIPNRFEATTEIGHTEQASCEISIPLNVSDGYRMEFGMLSYTLSGFIEDTNGYVSFKATQYFSDNSGPFIERTWGTNDIPVRLIHENFNSEDFASTCGGSETLKIIPVIHAHHPSKNSMIVLDSIDTAINAVECDE